MNFEGFKQAWKMGDWLAYFKNSILITVLVVIGSLIINSLAGSFGIFLCRQFYLSFPKELDESARMDGCGPLRTYFLHIPANVQDGFGYAYHFKGSFYLE